MKLPQLNQEQFTQIIEGHNFIQTKALRIGYTYSKLAQDAFKGIKHDLQFPDNWEKLEELDANSFTLSYEYNASCPCHPEYVSYQHSFPASLLIAGNTIIEHSDNDHQYDWNDDELTQDIKDFIEQEKRLYFLKQEEDNRLLAELRAKQEKHAQELKSKKEIEQRETELKLLEELKAKYPDPIQFDDTK